MSDFENELSNISHLRCFKIFDKDKSHLTTKIHDIFNRTYLHLSLLVGARCLQSVIYFM
jgi:hypothetical protein